MNTILRFLTHTQLCSSRARTNFHVIITAGMLKRDKKIWAPNFFGFLCGLNYFYQFQKHCSKTASNLPGTLSQHFNYSALVVTLTALIAVTLGTDLAATLIGRFAVLVCIVLFISPLSSFKSVIETKSAKSIPLPFTLTCMLNCFLW